MTENTKRPNALLGAITQMESAAFRAGQVGRRLLTEHPHLTLRRATCSTYSNVDRGYDDDPFKPRLEIRADSLDSARAWALALGAELTLSTRDATTFVLETGGFETEIDGVLMEIHGSRSLPDDEAAAWRAGGGAA